jgi:hypothetical protein
LVVILKRPLLALKDLGEPRESTEPALRERKRPKGAFGSLPSLSLGQFCGRLFAVLLHQFVAL